MPQGIRDAIASWEGVIGGLQFSQGCGLTGYGPNFLRSNVTGGYPCASYAYGCTVFAGNTPPPYDSLRRAYYPHSLDVWFNTTTYGNWTNNGYKAAAAHELGHVFGLDEQYEGWPNHGSCPSGYLNCPGAGTSIMDIATSTGHVDGVDAPQADDITKVSSFFYLMPVGPYVTSYGSAPGVLYLNFTDLSYVESTYRIGIYRCCVNDIYHLEFAWDHAASVGKRNVTNGIPWYRATSGSPPGYYSMCGHTFNTVSGYMHYFCMNHWFWVP